MSEDSKHIDPPDFVRLGVRLHDPSEWAEPSEADPRFTYMGEFQPQDEQAGYESRAYVRADILRALVNALAGKYDLSYGPGREAVEVLEKIDKGLAQ